MPQGIENGLISGWSSQSGSFGHKGTFYSEDVGEWSKCHSCEPNIAPEFLFPIFWTRREIQVDEWQ